MKPKKFSKKQKTHLIFDEKERTEYLTGFQKRKLARKLKAKQKLEALLKEEKKKIKQNQREALRNAIISQKGVPEIEHLLNPVTYDLPDHTVTISEIENITSVPVTKSLNVDTDDSIPIPKVKKKEDEVEKIRRLIKDLKTKRIKTIKKSSTQFSAKILQKKVDRAKAKRLKKQFEKSLKSTKKKHKKKQK